MNKLNNTQLINLIDSIIVTETEFAADEFTGGSVVNTITHNNTQVHYKLNLFFGYANKKPITRTIAISEDMYSILYKAITLKVKSMLDKPKLLDRNSIEKYIGSSTSRDTSSSTPTYTNTNTKDTLNTNTLLEETAKKYPLLKDLFKNTPYHKQIEKHAIDFIEYRKVIKKPLKTTLGLTAYLNTIANMQTKGYDIAMCIQIMKESEWSTMKPEWIDNRFSRDRGRSTGTPTSNNGRKDAIKRAVDRRYNNDSIEDAEVIE